MNIAHLEMWVVLVALCLWRTELTGLRFVIACDNQVVVNVINSGCTKNTLLQDLLREIVYELATGQMEMLVKYIPTKLNKIPDLLSRWETDNKCRQQFQEIKEETWREGSIEPHMWNINKEW